MVAEKIREHLELSGATVMMLSSRCRSARNELGIAAYFMKPVCQLELLDAILIAVGNAVHREPTAGVETMVLPIKGLRILLAEDIIHNRIAARSSLDHVVQHTCGSRYQPPSTSVRLRHFSSFACFRL
jgi:hypothetical protein